MKNIRTTPKGTTGLGDAHRWAWTERAACRPQDTALFYGAEHERPHERDARETRAREICSRCPVVASCYEDALAEGPRQWGVRGGATPEQLEAEYRRRTRKTATERRRQTEANPLPPPVRKPKPPKVVWESPVPLERRIRAASAAGRLIKTYSRLSGVSESFLSKLRSGTIRKVRKETADKIRVAYPLVLALEGEIHPEPLGAAAVHGWAAPEAWVGVDIDAPDAQPRTLEAA